MRGLAFGAFFNPFACFLDGVHDVLECNQWQPVMPDLTLKTWLLDMKTALHQNHSFDNVSMILIRLTQENQHAG